MNMWMKFVVAAFMLVGSSISTATAQPTVTNHAEILDGGRSVLITFVQDDLPSMEGCHYNIFAAGHRSFLKELPGNGVSVATFTRNVSMVQIIAGPLRSLKRTTTGRLSKRSTKIYLRTLIVCPGAENGAGDLISLSIPTKKNGTFVKVKKLVLAMKYHMQYYSPFQKFSANDMS